LHANVHLKFRIQTSVGLALGQVGVTNVDISLNLRLESCEFASRRASLKLTVQFDFQLPIGQLIII
jgi:hypothetical protein